MSFYLNCTSHDSRIITKYFISLFSFCFFFQSTGWFRGGERKRTHRERGRAEKEKEVGGEGGVLLHLLLMASLPLRPPPEQPTEHQQQQQPQSQDVKMGEPPKVVS